MSRRGYDDLYAADVEDSYLEAELIGHDDGRSWLAVFLFGFVIIAGIAELLLLAHMVAIVEELVEQTTELVILVSDPTGDSYGPGA